MSQKSLPEFERPPVVEVVCGVLFERLDTLLTPHVGQLWDLYKPEYPICQEAPPLPPVVEDPTGGLVATVGVSTSLPLPRSWFVSGDQTAVIQVQRDRFLYNWRRIRPEDPYPRYGKVVEGFKQAIRKFRGFIAAERMGELRPRQYEMSYVNHFPRGEGWTGFDDVSALMPGLSWPPQESGLLERPSSFLLNATLPLKTGTGNLYATVQNATAMGSGLPVIILDLTVRGRAAVSEEDAMWQWFSCAHDAIVRTFVELTDEDVQREVWGRIEQ